MDQQQATVFLTCTSEAQQFDVFSRALEVFKERSHVRGDLWAKFDIKDAQTHIASKLARITAAVERYQRGDAGKQAIEDAISDDAIDIINYAAFIVRHNEKIYP